MSQLTPSGRSWTPGLSVFAAAFMLISGLGSAIQSIVAPANSDF